MEAVKDALLGAGTSWVLWLLAGLLAVALAVAVERALFFRRRQGWPARLAARLENRLRRGEVAEARSELERDTSAAAAIAAAGLRNLSWGAAAVEKAMVGALAIERERLERGLSSLATIGNNAPFVGLFGTVVGVIHAFDELGRGRTAGEQLSDAVMSGIAEALVATAVGILVALPAVAAFNHLSRRVAVIVGGAEALTSVVVAYLLRSREQGGRPADGES